MLIPLLLAAGALGTLANKSLVTIKDRTSRSVDVSCNDNHLRTCLEIAEVQPQLVLDKEDISIDGVDLQFHSTVEPTGYVYKNEDGDEAVITISPKTGNMFGSLKTHDEKSYSIEKGRRGYVWKDFDTRSFKPEIPERSSAPKDVSKQKLVQQGVNDTTTVVTYSVMIYYTPEFAAATPDIEGWVDQVLAESNQGYVNTQMPVRITKLCIEAATINDMADTSDFISAFANMKGTTDALRNTADSAYLLAIDFNSCGVGYLATYDSGWTISVAQKSCALGYYTFAHEIGHNFGCHHDPDNADNSYFSYGHAHHIEQGVASKGYRTILAYSAANHQTRLNYYSNPLQVLDITQTSLGVADLSDNARLITENRFAFAANGDESNMCSEVSTSAPTTTPSTTAPPTTNTECQDGKFPKQLKPYKKIKKVKNWTQCRDQCNDDPRCEYFKWKDHKKWQKRICYLMEVIWQASSVWVSGEKFCV